MKTQGIAVILVLCACKTTAERGKRNTEISLFDPFAEQQLLKPVQNRKVKIRKLKTTSKPRPIKESQSATEAASSPAFVNRTELDFEADGLTRKETVDEDGNIVGSYSYKDPNGDLVVVRYVAGKDGYRVLSDTETGHDIPATDTTETMGEISNDDWIRDIKRRTTRRTTTEPSTSQ